MNSLDVAVLETAMRWVESGQSALLVTLVGAWGSAPRPVGSILALSQSGELRGSVSGGCIEDDLIARVHAFTQTGWPTRPFTTDYGVSSEEAQRFGLPCGGTLELVVEPLTAESGLKDTLLGLQGRERVLRILTLASGRVEVVRGTEDTVLRFDGQILSSVFGPRWRLLVIGAGPIAEFLIDMGVPLDLDVTVCDPRPEYQASWRRPAHVLDTRMPDDAVLAFSPDASSAIVALTHDPKQDDLALIEALGSRAFYVGALGSRANQAKRRARLLEFVSPAHLTRLRGPVGLPIGSRSPAELAIAILADLIACRNGYVLERIEHRGEK